MSPRELLAACDAAGIYLEARGDQLHVAAPKGSTTPELRDAIRHHKPALLALLAPTTEFISLWGGLTVPAPALRLALSLENRGFLLRVDADGQLVIQHVADVELSEAERLALVRWHLHVATIAAYRPPLEVDPLRGRDG